MSKAQKMIQNLDQLQITLIPYEAHYLQEFDQPTRALYLQMLYSVVSLSNLNNAQNRVWELLSQSIDADDVSTDEMGIELIKKFAEDAVADGLEYCFILDLLILLRLNSVSKDQAKVVAELMSILKLNDEDLATLMHLSNLILKIEDKVQNLVDFDYQTVRHWHEFSYQVLTENILIENFIAGNWLLTQDFMNINKTIEIKDSTFACLGTTFTIGIENSRIRSYRCAFKNNFNLKGCDAVFEACQFYNTSMQGSEDNNNLVFTKSVFENEFIASDILQSYFIMEKGQYEFTDSEFKLINISGIQAMGYNSKIKIYGSEFISCGNPEGFGAIYLNNAYLDMRKTNFSDCISKESGSALLCTARIEIDYSDFSKWNIDECKFLNCSNPKDLNQDWIGSARLGGAVKLTHYNDVYLDVSYRKIVPFIHNCEFVNSNLYLWLTHYDQKTPLKNKIENSTFIESAIFYIEADQLNVKDCQFENKGKVNVVEEAVNK